MLQRTIHDDIGTERLHPGYLGRSSRRDNAARSKRFGKLHPDIARAPSTRRYYNCFVRAFPRCASHLQRLKRGQANQRKCLRWCSQFCEDFTLKPGLLGRPLAVAASDLIHDLFAKGRPAQIAVRTALALVPDVVVLLQAVDMVCPNNNTR